MEREQREREKNRKKTGLRREEGRAGGAEREVSTFTSDNAVISSWPPPPSTGT